MNNGALSSLLLDVTLVLGPLQVDSLFSTPHQKKSRKRCEEEKYLLKIGGRESGTLTERARERERERASERDEGKLELSHIFNRLSHEGLSLPSSCCPFF